MNRFDRIVRTGYIKTAGRLAIVVLLIATLLISIVTISEANPEAAEELSDATTVSFGVLDVDMLGLLVEFALVWAFAPFAFQLLDDYREVIA